QLLVVQEICLHQSGKMTERQSYVGEPEVNQPPNENLDDRRVAQRNERLGKVNREWLQVNAFAAGQNDGRQSLGSALRCRAGHWWFVFHEMQRHTVYSRARYSGSCRARYSAVSPMPSSNESLGFQLNRARAFVASQTSRRTSLFAGLT